MAKILIVSAFYPPTQHIATNRIIAFTKYLQKFGHEITVLTVGDRNSCGFDNGINVVRVAEANIGIIFDTNKVENKLLHNIKSLSNLIMSMFISDENYSWTRNTIRLLKEEFIDINQFDIVVSSFPGIAAMEIAYFIKKINRKILWIADMRDAAWSPKFIWLKRRKLMASFQRMAKEIDGLLAVSQPQLELYTNLMENTGTIIAEVRNGYDFEIGKMLHNKPDSEFFTITYAGSFYGSIKPDKFFKALNNIEEQCRLKIKVRIIGNKAPIKIPISLTKLINQEETMSYCSLIDEIKNNVDALLMILPKGLESGIYTGKLFDYLGCCKPIIGLVPSGDVAEKLIKKANAGYTCDSDDIKAIEACIMKAYKNWENDIKLPFNLEVIKQHHREEQIKRMDGIIKRLLNKKVQ